MIRHLSAVLKKKQHTYSRESIFPCLARGSKTHERPGTFFSSQSECILQLQHSDLLFKAKNKIGPNKFYQKAE